MLWKNYTSNLLFFTYVLNVKGGFIVSHQQIRTYQQLLRLLVTQNRFKEQYVSVGHTN